MNNIPLMAAAGPDKPMQITPQIKQEWNRFLDYLNQRGYRGSKDLDVRDTNLGRHILEDYRKVNPNTVIDYNLVKPIQEAVNNDWTLMKQIQQLNGVKAQNADDRPLSPPDGWLGSMTSNGYFPTASTSDSQGRMIKDWGFDLPGYYQYLQSIQKIPTTIKSK